MGSRGFTKFSMYQGGVQWFFFGNFGLEIQTWESTSALMSKSDNQLVEIWNSFGVYVEIIKKLSSLVDSHLVTHT